MESLVNSTKIVVFSSNSTQTCTTYLRCTFVFVIYAVLLLSLPVYALQIVSIMRRRQHVFAGMFYAFYLGIAFWDGVRVTGKTSIVLCRFVG